jgi:glycosyltransferase involved in cell wall biosynthesis
MKLLIVTGIYPPDVGGPASFVPRLASALEARGTEVRVVTYSDAAQAPDDAGRRITRVQRAQNRIARPIALVRALLRNGRDAPVWLVQGLPMASVLTGKLLGKRQIHKIVGDGAWEVATLQGWYSGTLDAFQGQGGLRFRLLRLWNTLPLLIADEVVAPSQYLATLIARWGVDPRRIKVIYNAAESYAAPPTPRPRGRGPFELVTVCRLVPWKGVDGLLQALIALPDCRLTVLGDGPQAASLRRLADDLGVGDRVTWTGVVPPAGVREALRAADAFILNSTYEGLPHIVLEAFGAGVPVIATRAGGTPEVVADQENGLLIAPGQPEQLAAAVRRLQADEPLARALALRARAALDTRFSTAEMIDAYVRILWGPA